MKTCQTNIQHQFDIWHIGKNVKKKLLSYSHKKECEELKPWIKAINNHFWWCCASCHGNVINLKEKWQSILYHIRDKHRWEHTTLFNKCQRGKLSKAQRKEKKWLMEGSPSYIALEKVINDKNLINDLKYLVNFSHRRSGSVSFSI